MNTEDMLLSELYQDLESLLETSSFQGLSDDTQLEMTEQALREHSFSSAPTRPVSPAEPNDLRGNSYQNHYYNLATNEGNYAAATATPSGPLHNDFTVNLIDLPPIQGPKRNNNEVCEVPETPAKKNKRANLINFKVKVALSKESSEICISEDGVLYVMKSKNIPITVSYNQEAVPGEVDLYVASRYIDRQYQDIAVLKDDKSVLSWGTGCSLGTVEAGEMDGTGIVHRVLRMRLHRPTTLNLVALCLNSELGRRRTQLEFIIKDAVTGIKQGIQSIEYRVYEKPRTERNKKRGSNGRRGGKSVCSPAASGLASRRASLPASRPALLATLSAASAPASPAFMISVSEPATQDGLIAPELAIQVDLIAPESATQVDLIAPQLVTQAGLSALKPVTQAGLSALEPVTQAGLSALEPVTQASLSALEPATQAGLSALEPATQVGLSALEPVTQAGLSALEPVTQASLSALEPATQAGLSVLEPATQAGLSSLEPVTQAGLIALQPGSISMLAVASEQNVNGVVMIPVQDERTGQELLALADQHLQSSGHACANTPQLPSLPPLDDYRDATNYGHLKHPVVLKVL